MRKIYLSALALILGASVNAQIANPSFENWEKGVPVSWTLGLPGDGTLDVATPFTEGTTLTPIPDGKSYIRAESFDLKGSANNKDGTYGARATQQITTDVMYSEISFDVYYDIKAGDKGHVGIIMANAGGEPIGQEVKQVEGSSGKWETITLPLSHRGAPALYQIEFTSSSAAAKKGSWIAVDNIVFGKALETLPEIKNFVASDISDNHNGTDLQITFDVPADESNIEGYYVAVFAAPYSANNLLVPFAFFDQSGIKITPNGNNQTYTFNASDIYWDVVDKSFVEELIVENVEFVVSLQVKGKAGYARALYNSNPVTLKSPLSVADQYKEISIYPNPASDLVNFKVDGLENGTITINSVTGQEVVNTTINGAKKVDISNLNNGVYIYTVRNQNNEVVKTNKLVVRK